MTDTSQQTQPAPLPEAGSNDASAPSAGRRWHVLLVFPAVLVIAAGVLLTINLMGIGPTWFERAVIDGPAKKNFVLDTFMLCLLLGLLVFLSGRFWIPATFFAIAGYLLAFSNGVKLEVRAEPIYPSDLSVAGNTGFLGDMVDGPTIARVVLVVVGIAAVGALLGWLLRRRLPRVRRSDDPVFWKRLLVARLVCALLCGLLIAHAAWFNTPGNYWRKAYERVGSHWTPWDQDRNYRRNGFVGGFLYNLNGPTMTKPPGYGEAAMARVVRKYTRLAEQTNARRQPGALDDVNIVVVLSESFTDPLAVNGIELAEDPIPYTRRLMQQTYSGKMLAQKVGGGTANMEFEVLTGLSLAQYAAQMSTPYQMLLPRFRSFPGAARYFTDQQHEPIAIHPYSTRMYKRTTAYPTLGFDDFVYNETMQEIKRVPGGRFISDEAAFDEVNHQIEKSEAPVFINLVTMQNHYPYDRQFTDPIPVEGVGGAAANAIGRYTRGLAHSDEAMQKFIADLKRSDEKTAVIFYGDHLPGIYPAGIKQQNGDRNLHETPYFLWTNFQRLQHAQEPTTSPIYFLPALLDQLDAAMPPFFVLLDALRKEIPAMEQGRYINGDDIEVSYDELSPKAKALLRDYRLVQYDLSVGKQYSEKAMFSLPPAG